MERSVDHPQGQRPPAAARCWRAVMARDSRFDGKFVFAVRSTGIYCRPSCPARRPRRAQTLFFTIPIAAERAGFRACRRCRPNESPAVHPHAEKIGRVCRFIEANLDRQLTLSVLSAQAGLSSHQLLRSFRRVTGITPRQYAVAHRLKQLKKGLKMTSNVSTAMYDAGFGSSSRLYEHAPALLGMSPASYRQGGAGLRIRYSTAESSLGRVLVAATERGVCMVSLGDAAAGLEAALRNEFPQAQLERDSNGMKDWIRNVLTQVEGHTPSRRLPLDVQATAFQRRVWQELLNIPRGSTRSYAEVARAIGRRKAVRAVARACATNPVSVVIPCHRVVRDDGGLGGYRWGLQRKKALLKAEGAGLQA